MRITAVNPISGAAASDDHELSARGPINPWRASSSNMDATRHGFRGTEVKVACRPLRPGVPDAASAQVVVVGTTRDVAGIDIRLAKQRTYRVAGTVVDSRGQPLRGGFINYSRDTGTGGRTGSGVSIRPDGRFALEGLTPREYWPEFITGLPEPDADEEGEYVRQTLVVDANIDDLPIVTRPMATVIGEVLFEGAPAGLALRLICASPRFQPRKTPACLHRPWRASGGSTVHAAPISRPERRT